MFRKIISLVLVVLTLNLIGVSPAAASSQDDKEARRIQKIKENINKLGIGTQSRVELKLLDNRKLKGYIKEAGEDTFVVVDEKTGAATVVDYSQVKQAKGSNRLTAAKIAIGAAKGAAIVGAVAGAALLFALIFIPKT